MNGHSRGDFADAVAAVERLDNFDPPKDHFGYNAACIYALCVERMNTTQEADKEAVESYAS